MYELNLENLTEQQLEAFAVIDNAAYQMEKERRVREAIYTDKSEFMADISKAYYYIRPMFDNMRNNDTKKTLVKSGVIEMLEKFIRTAKKEEINYKVFFEENTEEEAKEIAKAEKIEKEVAEKVAEEIAKITFEPQIDTYKPIRIPYPFPNVGSPDITLDSQSQPAPISQPVQQPIPLKPEPIKPLSQPAPQPAPQPVPQADLNAILANIPVVGN
jgi:hypothetical protein